MPELPLVLVSVADIAAATGEPPAAVRRWLEETGRPLMARHNGTDLYLPTAAHALLEDRQRECA